MRNRILFVLACLFPLASLAQMDEQFYQPVKAWRGEHRLPPYEEIWVRDGADSIHAVWCEPAGEPVAVVFYCHGNFGNISYNDGIIRPLVEEGFAVFAWDYPGFGYSPGSPTHVAIARFGQRALDDVLARGDARGVRTIILGQSIGSQVATKLARDNRERISALVLDSGMSSFTDIALALSPEEAHPMISQFVTSPYSAQEDIRFLEGLPKLVMHSRDDRVVPFAQGEKVYGNAPEPKVFYEYPGGHVEAFTTRRDEVPALFRKLIE